MIGDYLKQLLFGPPGNSAYSNEGGLGGLGGLQKEGGLLVDFGPYLPKNQKKDEDVTLLDLLTKPSEGGRTFSQGYSTPKDMSNSASIAALIQMINQPVRQRQRRQAPPGYVHPAIRSLLGG